MTAAELIDMMQADGARLVLTPTGKLRVLGDPVQIERALPLIRQYERELVDVLQADRQKQEGER